MVLFSLLLLPLGYALIIYILFNTFFQKQLITTIISNTEGKLRADKQAVAKKLSLFSKKNIETDVKTDSKAVEEKVEKKI